MSVRARLSVADIRRHCKRFQNRQKQLPTAGRILENILLHAFLHCSDFLEYGFREEPVFRMNVVREKQFSALRCGKAKPRLFSFRARVPRSGMCVNSSAGQHVPIAVTVSVTNSAASWRKLSRVPLQHLH